MRSSPSVASRAGLAVVLLVGFYLLAIGVVCALLFLPYLEYRLAGRIEGRLGAFALLGAGMIIWFILPRPDRFEAPGPVLRERDHPRLFAALRSVARATRQEMPAEVFLVSQLNAWVAQRGGIMGFGSRRVMGLGLPLLEALTVRQFRAVVAHEFGHYDGGDTRLGPWIYKTRAAIERTMRGMHGSLLVKPFEWYGKMFLRVTHAVSRRQEFSADALAARIAGAGALREGLRALHGSDAAFNAYWSDELVPVLRLGARPPIAAGFRQFMAVPAVRSSMEDAIQRELTEGQAGPYDTHPCLRDRIAALSALPEGQTPGDDPAALTLLDRPDEVEAALIAFLGGAESPALPTVGWDDVGDRVWMPFWRGQAQASARALAGLTAADLPSYAADLGKLATRMALVPGNEEPGPAHGQRAAWLVAASMIVALHDRGWRLSALPGEPVSLTNGDARVKPFTLLHDLGTGALPTAEWLAVCLQGGIAQLDLGAAVGSEGAEPLAPPVPPAWSFVAMTYYGLMLNRTYRVVVTERWVCGARVRGLLSSPPVVLPQHHNPEFYVNAKLEARYHGVDLDSDAFLSIDQANFRIDRDDIVRVEHIGKKKWGMGALPSSGRVVLHLRDGHTRELILLGSQDAGGIVRGLAREPVLEEVSGG